MGKTINQVCLVIFIVLLIQTTAYSQTMYSLYDLAKLADTHSETIKIAQDNLYIAQQEKKRALSVLIPRAVGFGSLNEYKNDNISSPDTMTVGIKLTQSFTLNGKELIALDVTKKGIEGKTYVFESIRSQYLLQVAEAYYHLLSAQRFIEIAQSDVKRLRIHRDAVAEKLNVGNVTKTDLYRAEAELSKSLTELVRADSRVLQNKAAIRNLVDIEGDFNVQKENIIGIENFDNTLEEIQTNALRNRTEIKEAQKNIEIARKTVEFKKSDYWPSISLEAGYKETDIRYDHMPRAVEHDTEDLYFSGELVFTFFDGGLRRAEIRQAISDLRKAENALRFLKKSIILDSKISYLDYRAAKSTLLNLADELKFSQENYNAVQLQFKYGMADSIDMMDANTLLVSAQRRILDAKYVYYLSVLKILYTRGELRKFLLARVY